MRHVITRYYDCGQVRRFGLSELRLGSGLRAAGVGIGSKPDEFGWDQVQISTKVGRVLQPHSGDRQMWAGGLAFAESFDYTAPGLDESLRQSRARLGAPASDFLIIHDLEPERHGVEGIHTRLDELASDEGRGWQWLVEQRDDAKTIGGIGAGLNRLDMAFEFWNRGIDVDFFLVAGRLTLLENTADGGKVGELAAEFLAECKKRDTRLLLGGVFNSGILATGPDDPNAKFDYGAAPEHVVQRVRAVKAVCDAHNTPLAAAAMQYPLARHGQAGDRPAAGSGVAAAVIPGVDSVTQLQQNLSLLETPAPEALWADLAREGLCD